MPKPLLSLGNINGPLLIFGGPYSNLQALQAIRKQAEALSIPPEHCICTGDIVAYCAQPKETVAEIRDWGVHCLMGNCEESFSTNSDDCGCGFEEGTSCDVLSNQWFEFSNQQLTSHEREWFASLPESIEFFINHKKAIVIHGSLSSINQFIFESSDENIFHHELSLTDADLVIGGHCGIPFTKKIHNRIWHNAGAIGMPANDGTTRTWFSILSVQNEELAIDIQPLAYDHLGAFNAMKKAGICNAYADTLINGLWPSMDVLPEREKQKRGLKITKSRLQYG